MVSRFRTPFPSASALIAFEAAGRLGNFSRAAEELRTSQSAISRHIAGLEARLGARLFDRSPAGVRLTGAGSRLYDGVAGGLGTIERAVAEAREAPDEEHVVIACSHDAWHLLFTPRLDALRQALGGPSALRFLLHPGDPRDGPPDPDADLVFTWDGKDAGPQDLALPEAAGPVCSPGYAARNAAILGGPVGAWVGMTLLDSPVPGRSRGSWEDWFEAAGHRARPALLDRAPCRGRHTGPAGKRAGRAEERLPWPADAEGAAEAAGPRLSRIPGPVDPGLNGGGASRLSDPHRAPVRCGRRGQEPVASAARRIPRSSSGVSPPSAARPEAA